MKIYIVSKLVLKIYHIRRCPFLLQTFSSYVRIESKVADFFIVKALSVNRFAITHPGDIGVSINTDDVPVVLSRTVNLAQQFQQLFASFTSNEFTPLKTTQPLCGLKRATIFRLLPFKSTNTKYSPIIE